MKEMFIKMIGTKNSPNHCNIMYVNPSIDIKSHWIDCIVVCQVPKNWVYGYLYSGKKSI